MTKNYKAVLKSSLVMLVLFAVAGSGVAQAQECFAFQSGANTVRAEGITETVGDIQLQCRAQEAFGLPPIGDEAVISITLNTAITNETNDDGDMVMGLTYNVGSPALGNAADYVGEGKEVLSDGNTITWTIGTGSDQGDITFPNTATGSTVTISGIMANASMVGDGNDVTAEVRVNGVVIKHSPIKLADVTTGLDITVTSATGLQCEAGSEMATIKFVEGFASALRDTDSLVVTFRGIPEGVTVTPSMMGTGMALEMTDLTASPQVISGDLAPLTLMTEGEMNGLDEDGNVALSTARAGQIIYNFVDEDPSTADVREGTDPMKAMEWNELTITFEWEAGEPTLNTGSVTVSYHPVTDDVSKMMRYVAGPTNDVIEIDDCVTTLLFPFVTNQATFDTGLVITNTSEGSGSCTIEYSGSVDLEGEPPDAPADLMSGAVEGGKQWIALVSAIAKGFQGYITATCDFREAYGFAFLTDGYGGEPTLAQSYLAVCTDCDN